MAFEKFRLLEWLSEWQTLVGKDPIVWQGDDIRELWQVEASSGERYFLKRLSPWRNLPLLSEYRMLIHVLEHGIRVPAFQLTDSGAVSAGSNEESFVLMRSIGHVRLSVNDIPDADLNVGRATALLHDAMARYPQPLGSYTENIKGGLTTELRLSVERLHRFNSVRDDIITGLTNLPLQIIHGDFTPDNVLHLSDGRGIGFIDFDHLPMAPRIWDIAKYLSRRLRFRWCEAALDTVRLDCVSAFVAGYNEVSRLEQAEILALPGATLAYNILEASYDQSIADGVLERRMLPDHADVLEDTLRTIDWQLSNPNDVPAAVIGGIYS